ncbi:hypothetical protein VdG1_05922 [Verticillium dahliae VDG1]|nr:hypothetical protein VdG1_05922 [Verticillium dahliae VDG1]
MPRREASPTPSDGGYDIGDSLFAVDDGASDDGKKGKRQNAELDFDVDDILHGDDDGDDGDEAFIALKQAAANRKTTNLTGKVNKKGGGFQVMGLNSNLLRAITKKGFVQPTPIQRKTIPLIMDRKDVVGMARTGSGKTAAFVIPMIERLKTHSAKFGARALIMSPSRELAIQTLRVVKDFNKGTDLKAALVVGGDSMDEQFSLLSANPDIIIATPGRFLHLKVEMSLNLSSIQYVVFDEADRLFEMGFAAQLTEILHALPPSRQSLLFSATLPASLVEFARAGLQDPTLVRLDIETKVSPDLESAFFGVKGAEKEASLLHILHDIIKMPLGSPDGMPLDGKPNKKRKRGKDGSGGKGKPTEHSTIIFAATKHHVEYLANLLRVAGFAVSYVYGALDQEARRIHTENFRNGRSNILVVTDVAARGIDIPVLANVINYDFPPQPKVFVHRVGRTARAGQRGWAYSIVRELDAPYLLDLQLFLGRKMVVGRESESPSYNEEVVVGALPRNRIEVHMEVSVKAEKLYLKTRNSASSQSARRARETVGSKAWSQLHPLFDEVKDDDAQARAELMAKVSGYRPHETIFEISRGGKAGNSEAAEVMKELRKRITPRRGQAAEEEIDSDEDMEDFDDDDDDEAAIGEGADEMDGIDVDDSDDDLEVTVSNPDDKKKKAANSYRDDEIFMGYTPRTINTAEERGYGISSGTQTSSFVEQAREAAMNLTNDDGGKAQFGDQAKSGMRWDKKQNKYLEKSNAPQIPTGVRYKHNLEKAPKEADKFRDDYHVRKKRVAEAKEKRIGRFKDGAGSKFEIKGAEDIRKARKEAEKKRAKNARPSRRK